MDAATLPRSWASMYLIYEAIADSVGGRHNLDNLAFVTKKQLSDFSHAANNMRGGITIEEEITRNPGDHPVLAGCARAAGAAFLSLVIEDATRGGRR